MKKRFACALFVFAGCPMPTTMTPPDLTAVPPDMTVVSTDMAGGGGDGGMGPYNLNLTLQQFSPHNGQNVHAKLREVGSNTDIDSVVVAITMGGGNKVITFTGKLVHGHSYDVYFWADINGNDVCDTAPTDHTWMKTYNNVMADVTDTYMHATVYQSCPP